MITQTPADARLEDVEFMVATGETWEGIAHRLGLAKVSLEKFLYRAARPDLARQVRRPERLS